MQRGRKPDALAGGPLGLGAYFNHGHRASQASPLLTLAPSREYFLSLTRYLCDHDDGKVPDRSPCDSACVVLSRRWKIERKDTWRPHHVCKHGRYREATESRANIQIAIILSKKHRSMSAACKASLRDELLISRKSPFLKRQ